jgi:UPF0755 protein
MAKFFGFILSFGLLMLIAASMAGLYAYSLYVKPGMYPAKEFFIIEKGTSVAQIANNLEERGLIERSDLFILAARLTDKQSQLKAGEYLFPPALSTEDILEMIASGAVVLRQFTISEGLTSWQVVQELNAVEELEGDITDIPLEGTLLPETYNFQKGDSRADKIERMRAAMEKTVTEAMEAYPEIAATMNVREILTLASIIEKETSVAHERRKVSGVFHNRLNRGMPLQTDPTVIYAITKGEIQSDGRGPLGRRLLRKDLQYDSPYNTYKYPGLPPGPIANPGRASIEAALNPETHDYVYFVADGTGGHAFGKTLVEHNANVAKWRQFRRNSDNP